MAPRSPRVARLVGEAGRQAKRAELNCGHPPRRAS